MLETVKRTSQDMSAREWLLEVGAKLFAEKGLEGTSVRDIAKVAGLNLSLVSYYFGGKEGLYREIIQNFALTIKSEVENIVRSSEAEETSKENLEKVFMTMVTSFSSIRARHPHHGIIMQRERIAGLPHARDIYEKIFTPLGQSLVGVITRAQKKDLVRKNLNPLLVFIFLQEAITGFHTLMSCQLEMTQSPMCQAQNFKDFQNQLVTIFVQGIFL